MNKRKKKKKYKINLGDGGRPKKGYIGLDLYAKTNIKADVIKLPFSPNSIDHLYACHLIEHLPIEKIDRIIEDWYIVLKNKGILDIRCPNAVLYVKEWLKAVRINDLELLETWANRNVLGWGNLSPGMLNRCLYTPKLLKHILERNGFIVTYCVSTTTRVKVKTHIEYRKKGDLICQAQKILD